ncbi:MAG: hypothetical protein EOP04_04230 [Proteobacteria bacterium]|nr:MAG: hypothetical protein EOP04_04230 [Pseudomonadota bacterium]
MKNLLRMTALAIFVPSLAYGIEMKDMPNAIPYKADSKAKLELPPLDYGDVENPMTGDALNEFDVVLIENNGSFETFTGDELLSLLNKQEKNLNRIGESIRKGAVELTTLNVPNPDFTIRGFSSDTGVSLEKLAESYKDGIDDCKKIDISALGINPLTQQPFQPSDKISLSKNVSLKVSALVPKLDQQQKMFCALGYSLFENFVGENPLASLLTKRDELVAKFGISTDDPQYSLNAWVNTSTLLDIASRATEIQDALKNPSPEKLYILAQSNKDLLPEALQLPDLPRFDSPTLNRRTDLKLLKSYRWPGFTEGKRELLQAYAGAWSELRAGHASDGANAPVSDFALQGEASAGLFVFNQDIPVLKGNLDAKIDPTDASAELTFCYLGNCSKKHSGKNGIGLSAGDPEAFKKNWQQAYSMQTAIGPVPVVLRAGAALYGQLGWSTNLTLLSAYGDVTGTASGDVFGEAAVGIKDFIEAGAGGKVEVIKDTLSLKAEANLKFKGNGYPMLDGTLTGDNQLSALNGGIYGYAMVDLAGPLGALAEKIVDTLANLGSSAEEAIRKLSNVSDTAKKLVQGFENAGKSIGKAFKKARKRLGFQAPLAHGTGFAVQVTGLKIRYQEDVFTWDGIQKNNRFLNYKIIKAPEGLTLEGDKDASFAEQMANFEQNLDAEAYKAQLQAMETQTAEIEQASLSDLNLFLQESASAGLTEASDQLGREMKVLQDRKSDNIQKTLAE